MGKQSGIPKGTRDFLPHEVEKRNYIFDTIKSVFRQFGFLPIETPAMENLSTLLGKYGEEGDKLLYKILNSGDFLKSTNEDLINSGDLAKIATKISDKGLRYDLTVPFARFVVQHFNEIQLPFKRYQIQSVWRADRPQKGRYREFFQCDADVIGSKSLFNELELIQLVDEVFSLLNIKVEIRLNNRKILSGIAEFIGESDKLVNITVAIDKFDKIGLSGVKNELLNCGLNQEQIDTLEPIILLSGSNTEKLEQLKLILKDSTEGIKGIEELETVFSYAESVNLNSNLNLDLTLARGLNYYTGIIIEVVSTEMQIGSICGGGRYDDLTSIFGMKDISGVGISFGADRIYDVLMNLERFPDFEEQEQKILFLNFGAKEALEAVKLLSELRKAGKHASLYPDSSKIKKQMNFANKSNYKYVIIIGESELEQRKLAVKNMQTGEQEIVSFDQLTDYFAEK